MLTEINAITQQFFQQYNLEKVSKEELEGFINKYPYNASARYLLAQKLFEENGSQYKEEVLTAGLYINNPLWLNWLLTRPDIENNSQQTYSSKVTEEKIQETVEENSISEANKSVETKPDDSPIVFQSYHTIDYFASQGIRLQQADLGKDRLGQQLKSFTEWLRSMKRLPSAETDNSSTPQDEAGQLNVIRNAKASIRDKEIVTEAMAEVWIKQGQPQKAVEIYNKLSLLDPAKSAYFASKIDQLK